MNPPLQRLRDFFDRFTLELKSTLFASASRQAEASWTEDHGDLPAEFTWWSASLREFPQAGIFAGASPDTWQEFETAGDHADPPTGAFPVITEMMQVALSTQFGSEALAPDSGAADAPPSSWVRIAISFETGALPPKLLYLTLSPEAESVLTSDAPIAAEPPAQEKMPMDPLGVLLRVEIPVSVSFGKTRVRLKDLLSLDSGSIVELDQALGDLVEIKVNGSVIAKGEVVAVEGHYGVRIIEMTQGATVAAGGGA